MKPRAERVFNIQYSCDSREELAERIVGLEDENAELRELLTETREELSADKAGMFHKLILSNLEEDMRELGIEVRA